MKEITKLEGTLLSDFMFHSVKEITKLEGTLLSDFMFHTEECEKQAFFSVI